MARLRIHWAGGLLALAIVALFGAALVAVLLQAGTPRLTPADWRALRFSVLQAGLSALLSVAFAIPVAQALARRRFVGRGAVIALLGAPFLLPVIVAALGLLAIFGHNGVLNSLLRTVGLPDFRIYGLQGVVIGHVFLNLPLAARMLLHGWQTIPLERIRLAQSLGLGPLAFHRHVAGPMLRQVLPGAALAVFLICLTSFALVLILGGGPGASTIELEIYHAIRFDFDLARAAVLAALQFAICAALVAVSARWATPAISGAGLDRAIELPAPSGWRRGADGLWIITAVLFLLVPVGTVLARGLPGLLSLPAPVWLAAQSSVLLALTTASLTGICLVLIGSSAGRGNAWPSRLTEAAAMLPMAASGLVLGTGLFLLINPWVAPSRLALPVTALVNTLLALPFALRLVLPSWRLAEATQGRLADSLGLGGFARLRYAILPRLRRPFGMALGLSAALSMGDLGVITLFASDEGATLPLQLFSLMGAYRSAEAEAAAALLILLSFGLFLMFDLWGRRDAKG